MIFRIVLLITLISTSCGVCQTLELDFFNLSAEKIASEGSIIYYSNNFSSIDSSKYLAIEGWDYDVTTKKYNYFCYIKIGNDIIRLDSVSTSISEKSSVYKNDDIALTIVSKYYKKSSGESYFVKGKLTFVINNTTKTYDIFGLAVV